MNGPFAFAPFAARSIPVTASLDAGLEAYADLTAGLTVRASVDAAIEAYADLTAGLAVRASVDAAIEAYGTGAILYITNPLRVRAFDASGSYIVAVDRSEGIP